jgi:hypothetical protein
MGPSTFPVGNAPARVERSGGQWHTADVTWPRILIVNLVPSAVIVGGLYLAGIGPRQRARDSAGCPYAGTK